ncbi:MAG: beta-lactamase regulating signal transducer with metallopeptidase domain [Planctomycetota bacterium]|jgi:beta-lactamase regulating signal transducer with metallopeptidase domain
MIGLATIASDVLAYALERSVAFAVVFLVTGCLWILLRRWMSSHAGSLWFLLPLAVLVVPVERWIPNPWADRNPIESVALAVLPTSVEEVLVNPATEGFLDFSGWRNRENPGSVLDAGKPVISVDGGHAWDLPAILLGVWILGLLVFLVRLMRAQRVVPRLLSRARLVEPKALSVDMDELRHEANVSGAIVVLESPDFDSPALWAGELPRRWRRVSKSRATAAIVIPEGLVARLSARELRWVFLHELAHLSRRDHLAELIQRVLGAVFFFHPLVWLTNHIARSHREMACDDAALARCAKEDRPRCARALFEVVAHATALAGESTQAANNHRTTHAMATLFHSKKLTRKRIMRLIEIDRPLARGLRFTALLPVLIASVASIAAARFPAGVLQGEAIEEVGLTFVDDPSTAQDHGESPGNTLADARYAVTIATDWLLGTQGEDGGWKYRAVTREPGEDDAGWASGLQGEASGGGTNRAFEPYHTDVALTALALQALTRRASFEPKNKPVLAAIDRAVQNLVGQQNPETGVFGEESISFMVGQALATEALARANAGRMTPELQVCLERAVAFLERSRNPYGAWRYDSPPLGDNDTRVTGYVMLALTAAFDVQAHAAPQTFAAGMDYMLLCENNETGRTNYMEETEYAFRLFTRHKSHPAEHAEAPTAMHMRLRNSAGLRNIAKGAMDEATALLGRKAPRWDIADGWIDYTYWWQGTEALAGSEERGKAWQHWSLSLRNALLTNQVLQGPLKGTWPTVDAWSDPGLEDYTAATGALALYALLDAE